MFKLPAYVWWRAFLSYLLDLSPEMKSSDKGNKTIRAMNCDVSFQFTSGLKLLLAIKVAHGFLGLPTS